MPGAPEFGAHAAPVAKTEGAAAAEGAECKLNRVYETLGD